MTPRYLIPLFLLIFALPGFFSTVSAQQDTSRMNQQVEVIKAYKPSVSKAGKINLLPEINDTTHFRPDLNYKIISHPVTTGFHSSDLKASNQIPREITYPGYGKISGGFGTNLTPFFDFYLSNPNSVNGTLGMQLNHLSSQGSVELKGGNTVNAPFSYNKAVVFGSYVYEGVTISSELSYRRDMNRFYGYPITIPADILTNNFVKYFNQDQMNQLGYFALSVRSNATSVSPMKFNTNVNLGYFNTSSNQVEKAMRFKGDFDYNFGTFNGKLIAVFAHFDSENVTEDLAFPMLSSPKASWLQLSPTVNYQNELFTVEGGFNLYSVFDDLHGTTLKPYPKIDFSFHTADKNFTVYAGLDGYLENNNYSKIAEENRWINPTLIVKPTSHLSTFSGGIKGKITTPLTFNIGAKYGKTEDQYFYVTRVEQNGSSSSTGLASLTYNNAFEVVYDNLTTLDFSGDLSYTTGKMFLLLSGHFYSYQTNTLEKAPYMPDFTLHATTEFKVTDHFSGLAEMYLTGPRDIMLKYYQSPISSATPPPPIYLKSDAVIDVNFGVKYSFTSKFDFFGKVENLLNRKDEIWYGYTVQGIRFKLGASLSF